MGVLYICGMFEILNEKVLAAVGMKAGRETG
jgi:hypothetical protein